MQVIVTATLVLLLSVTSASAASKKPNGKPREIQLYRGVPLDAHLLALDKDALEQAYKAHLANKLWATWLADGATVEGAERISKGLMNARRAYHTAVEQIEQREKEIQDRAARAK